MLAWQATEDAAAKGASGDMVWSPSQPRGYMRFRGLLPSDPKVAQYQLWIFDKQRDEKFPVDGGVFDVDANGEVIVPISPKLRSPTRCCSRSPLRSRRRGGLQARADRGHRRAGTRRLRSKTPAISAAPTT